MQEHEAEGYLLHLKSVSSYDQNQGTLRVREGLLDQAGPRASLPPVPISFWILLALSRAFNGDLPRAQAR